MIAIDASYVIAVRDPGDAHHAAALAYHDTVVHGGGVLHDVTLAECLIAAAKRDVLADAEGALRSTFTIESANEPAEWATIRASFKLTLPDAIVARTALTHDANGIATFDHRLRAWAEQHNLAVPAMEMT